VVRRARTSAGGPCFALTARERVRGAAVAKCDEKVSKLLHILPDIMLPVMQSEGPIDVELFAALDERLDRLVTDLLWWANALAAARAGTQQ
jgi:hypothetical protein